VYHASRCSANASSPLIPPAPKHLAVRYAMQLQRVSHREGCLYTHPSFAVRYAMRLQYLSYRKRRVCVGTPPCKKAHCLCMACLTGRNACVQVGRCLTVVRNVGEPFRGLAVQLGEDAAAKHPPLPVRYDIRTRWVFLQGVAGSECSPGGDVGAVPRLRLRAGAGSTAAAAAAVASGRRR
jgi:hypothetical protein